MSTKKNLLGLNPQFVEKIGKEKIEAFEVHVRKAAEGFENILFEGAGKATTEARVYMGEMLDLPEFAEHKAELLSAARLIILDSFCCASLAYAAELAVDLKLAPSELAHHMLQHYEAAGQRQAMPSSLSSILQGLVPEDLREPDASRVTL